MESFELQQESNSSGVRDFLTVVFRHKSRIVIVFFTVIALASIATFMITPMYRAESSLLVKIGREYLNRPEVGSSNSPVMSLSQEEITNSEIQILTNRDLVEKVINSLKLENIYPELLTNPTPGIKPMDLAVVRFLKSLKVEAVKKSSVLQISFDHKDPHVSANALNLLVEYFKEKHLEVFSDPKSSFLEMQVAEYGQKLRNSENNLQAYKQRSGVFSLEEQRKLLLEQRSGLDTALKSTQHIMHEMQKRIDTLKDKLNSLSQSKTHYTSTERERIIVDTKSKLISLQLNEQELLKKYTENSRFVTNTRKEIAMLQEFIKEQENDISNKVITGNPIYQSTEMDLIKAETELNAQRGKAVALKQQLTEIDKKVRSLDFSEKDLEKLKREQIINEKNYQAYTEKSEEARITEDMNRLKMSNISVIQKAITPIEPIKPKKMLNLLLGLAVGIVAGLGSAFISEATSHCFSSPAKLENRLGMTVLSAIPYKEG